MIVLLACSGPEPADRPRDSDEPVPSFTGLATEAGNTVGVGVFEFSRYENCCLPGASCLWNNPSTPYGTYAVPPSPGQLVADPDVREDGLSRNFRLRPDEALVFLGRTPPPSKYFSWRSYLTFREVPAGPALVIGSLGPSLNDLVVDERQDPLFDAPFAIVTTLDAAVERRVTEWLVAAGWSAENVHPDRIPLDLVRPGLDEEDDVFSVVARVAVYDDAAAGDAWLDDPGAVVLRLTPGVEEAVAEPHPRVPVPVRGSGTDEEGWREAVDRLEAAIRAAHPGFAPIVQESNAWHYETYACIEEDAYCSGEIRDRYYARVPDFRLPGDGSFAVAFGVNHERTGKASYANVSVETVENQIGLEAVESDRFVGSARAYLPDDPQVDDLYAVAVARDCAPFTSPCIEVATGCPGVDFEDPMVVDFRAYLEPATGAAPHPDELLPDRVLKFF